MGFFFFLIKKREKKKRFLSVLSAVLNTWLLNWILFRLSLLREPCLSPLFLPVSTCRLAGCAGARSEAISVQVGWWGPHQNATRENELLAWLWGQGNWGCAKSLSRGKRWHGRRVWHPAEVPAAAVGSAGLQGHSLRRDTSATAPSNLVQNTFFYALRGQMLM